MLPAENRLAKKRDFDLILAKGYTFRNSNLALKVLTLAKNRDYFPKREDPDQFARQLRIGFAVGLKLSKKAVERNRLRRQLREAVRLVLKNEGIKSGHYLLFVPNQSLKNKNFAEISEEVKSILGKGQLLV